MIEINGVTAFGFVTGYERKGLYSMEEVHAHIGEEPHEFDGDLIKMDSHRYALFARAHTCVRCGLKGSFYAKERSARFVKSTGEFRSTTNLWHFNLYALLDGAEPKAVLMTKDHILPKSRGGRDEQSNYQPMCSPCNTDKGHRIDGETDEEFQNSPGQIKLRANVARAKEEARNRRARKEAQKLKALKTLVDQDG